MSNKPLIDFFDSLVDDQVEKEIVRQILKGKEEEEIIEKLLKVKQQKK